MSKFKIINKGYKKEVKVKLTRGEIINNDELHILSTCSVSGLIAPALIGKKKLLYTVSGKCTLVQYLSRQMSIKRFLSLLMQVINVTKALRVKGLSSNNLMLEQNFIFVNEATKRLIFIYKPINSKDISGDIFSFFAYMLSAVSLNEGEDWRPINKISGFINSQRVYSPENFEQFLLGIDPELMREEDNKERQNHFGINNWSPVILSSLARLNAKERVGSYLLFSIALTV